jgi:hypothetical protein
MYSKILPILAVFATPAFAFAESPDFSYLDDAVTSIGLLVGKLIPILIALGLLFFIWGLVQFIMAGGDDAAKEKGKSHMVWGIIALFVMISVWGIVGLLSEITGVETGGTVDAPSVNF